MKETWGREGEKDGGREIEIRKKEKWGKEKQQPTYSVTDGQKGSQSDTRETRRGVVESQRRGGGREC